MMSKIFIHGLESSGRGFKGQYFKKIFPDILTPDFTPFSEQISISDLLEIRMKELEMLLNESSELIIIGSSFGGLMATLYAFRYPEKIKLLILLAPFLSPKFLNLKKNNEIRIPTIIFHGKNDNVCPVEETKRIARKIFPNLTYNIVDDDHYLRKTVQSINWVSLIHSH
ncbi:MAG: alpha/beta fold hydrolase [Promethearchaeota archaeon]